MCWVRTSFSERIKKNLSLNCLASLNRAGLFKKNSGDTQERIEAIKSIITPLSFRRQLELLCAPLGF